MKSIVYVIVSQNIEEFYDKIMVEAASVRVDRDSLTSSVLKKT